MGINPITRFPGQGLYVFGQRTMQAYSSALDRVNVGRLLAYLRERFDPLARPFIFEPNDKITRANAKQVFDSFLADMISKRAIYDFIVVCDETNNTPARIDRNELWIDVAIEPVKAAEFIYIPIRVVNTGELSA
jgi:phage tail sheath protein FI